VNAEDFQQAVKEAKELIKMLEATSVSRMRLVAGGFKILVERTLVQSGAAVPMPVASSIQADGNIHRVLSPMVGTFYHSPAPGQAPFVEVGSRVVQGQAIGIVEAMKVMNTISSDVSGIVVEILVPSGQAVQFEQPLVAIDTTG
jgi:acetyl-CoA carboxylase biotin carboxyl carrier protein